MFALRQLRFSEIAFCDNVLNESRQVFGSEQDGKIFALFLAATS
jgi:hypothetical protein